MKGLCLLAMGLLFAPALRAQSPYAATFVDGFTVKTKADCFAGAPEGEVADFQDKLRGQIALLNRELPADKLARLKRVPIYVHRGEYRAYGAVHHPSREWLLEHHYPAEMANSVEICHWQEFRALVTYQPACLLHEYAHAWHFLAPGMNQLIRPAYQHALKAGLYTSVAYVRPPSPRKGYALENEKEYFAELSEAYFARNDFFPFTREELKAYDPAGYAMIERVWGVAR